MRRIDTNQAIQLLANVGVIVGIAFLASEIRLNTRAIQAQTRDSISEKEMQLYAWQATNSDLAAVVAKARDEGSNQLNTVEAQMFFAYMEAFFREHENALYQFERGLFSEGDFSGRVQNMRVFLGVPAFRRFWANRRDHYSPSMRTEIDDILSELDDPDNG